jgi:hypothetical protein
LVLFEVELSVEGFVDGLDGLPQRLEQGSAGSLPFALAAWPQQLDALLGTFVFEGAAEVVPVADQCLAFPGGEEVRFGREEVQRGLVLVGLGVGRGEGDGQAVEGAQQVRS